MAQEICRPYGTLSRTPRRESEGGNPSAVLIGWGFGEGKNRNFPSPNAFFGHLSLRKERCKQFSSKRTQQDNSVHYGQNIFKLHRGKISPTAKGLSFVPSLPSCGIFPQKQIRSPRRSRKERHCCCRVVIYYIKNTFRRFSIALLPGSGIFPAFFLHLLNHPNHQIDPQGLDQQPCKGADENGNPR